MYSFPYYKVADKEEVIAFMKAHPFITLLGTDKSGRIEATQVPVLVDVVDDKIYISGHIMRKTTHENALIENPDALIIFTGAHAYVSATYYTTNPYQGSTWNYIAIHARGKIRWMDEQGLINFMRKLTLHFEKTTLHLQRFMIIYQKNMCLNSSKALQALKWKWQNWTMFSS
jgi:transcriptional regulator